MKYAAAMIAILLLAGCSKPKDVAYYKSHSADRAKRVEECSNSGEASDDCRIAKQAETEVYDDEALDYYKGHPAALAKRVEDCAGRTSHDCQNAKRAASLVGGKPAQPPKPATTAQK